MRRLPEGYSTLNLDGEEAYVKVNKPGQLRRVGAVIFDCDGVLIDTRDSYDRAISKSVAYVFEALTGYSTPEGLISDEVISLFRRSGGFNNDWDTVYGILMFILCELPERLRCRLEKEIEQIGSQPDPFKRISSIRESVEKIERDELGDEFFEEAMDKLKKFTELLDETGVDSVDRNLAGAAENSEDLPAFVKVLKRFLCYPGDVGESIIATVFEEFFCGSELFMETYRMEPRFYKGLGLVENERSIIRPETLDRLTYFLGRANLGVASGSRLIPAKYILREILERFDPKASIFLDDVEKAESEQSNRAGLKVNLKKPNPFSLLKAAEAFNPRSIVLYVGDSMADAMTVREANKADPRFIFAGVYGYSHPKEVLLRDFIEFGCDVVLPSVNELPLVLEEIRRGSVENR